MAAVLPSTGSRTHSPKAWAQAIAQPAQEFSLTPLKIIAGKLPEGLQGSLYRNGPGRLTRGQQRVGHWFDGDGAILAIHFTPAQVTAAYRYVQSADLQQEAAADRYLFPNYGMRVPGPCWNSWGKTVKNAANTSVFAFENKLLALWEGGWPHALDLHTLETKGIDPLSALKPGMAFSAHPKPEIETDTVLNFGITIAGGSTGVKPALHLYRCDPMGRIVQQQQTPLPALGMIHDFVMAGAYVIFCLGPVRLNRFPVVLGLSSFSDALTWQPELGTQILVFERDRLTLVAQAITEPWFQWHFSNGAQRTDGTVDIELVRYSDWQTNQYLKEVATGHLNTSAPGHLWHVHLDPQSARVLESHPCSDRSCEFPTVAPHQVGQPWRFTYCSVHRAEDEFNGELLGEIARYDHQTGELITTYLGESCYPSEPIFAPNPHHPGQGWLLTVVYNGRLAQSEVHIYASDRLADPPLCCLALPQVIHHSFHGTWRPA